MYQLSVYVHILAAMVWLGGIFFLALVAVPVTRDWPPAERAVFFEQVGRRFRTVGWLSIAILIITGLINSVYRGVTLESLARGDLITTASGRLLLVKVGLVISMLGVSAVHDLVIGPASVRALKVGRLTPIGRRLRQQSTWLARLSALLGLLVVAAAVGLVRGWPF